jgi:formylglycine-generating enzyme
MSGFVSIPAGWFWMGSEGRYAWESPRHRVFLSTFDISTTSVTRAEYAFFLNETGHGPPKDWTDPNYSDPNQPVVGVSWFDAVAYAEWLSATTSEHFRLPTEAEWEHACRGDRDLREYAWGDQSPGQLEYFSGKWTSPRPVAQWKPNDFGLFNMGDNVHEWCMDWYSADYYAVSPAEDPKGPEVGTRRVSRGGSWRHLVKGSRAAHRSSLPPSFQYTDYGFRLVRAPQS